MWVFGYGSLMWDNWHEERSCLRVSKAKLTNYRRRFNKASISNWGTRDNPCPTLNVEKCQGSDCEGLAYEFADSSQEEILSYLGAREGRAFQIQRHMITLDDGNHAEAYVPVYMGPNILNKDNDALLNMALVAIGTSGECKDYITNLAAKLEALEIDDREVRRFSFLVQQREDAQRRLQPGRA